MDHRTGLSMAGGGINLPAFCGGRDEHGPRGGSSFAKNVISANGAAASAGAQANPLEARRWGRLFQTNLGQVRFQFVGQHHGESGAHSLSHFGASYPKDDLVIGANLDIRIGREVSRTVISSEPETININHQTHACQHAGLQERATSGAHALLPWRAARWTALRMRW